MSAIGDRNSTVKESLTVQKDDPKREYQRPDIVILRSIWASHDQIRSELKTLGAEEDYIRALRVLKTQGQLIAAMVSILIDRYEAAGDRP